MSFSNIQDFIYVRNFVLVDLNMVVLPFIVFSK